MQKRVFKLFVENCYYEYLILQTPSPEFIPMYIGRRRGVQFCRIPSPQGEGTKGVREILFSEYKPLPRLYFFRLKMIRSKYYRNSTQFFLEL